MHTDRRTMYQQLMVDAIKKTSVLFCFSRRNGHRLTQNSATMSRAEATLYELFVLQFRTVNTSTEICLLFRVYFIVQ